MARSLIAAFLLLFFPMPSDGSNDLITGPEVRMQGSDVYASFSLTLDGRHSEEIRKGINKELRFYVDLFKVWRSWPDEFVLGKSFVRSLRVDPIKKEYIATSFDGAVLIEKRFKSIESMIDWTLSVRNLKLTNTRELEPGQYFVRVTAESKILKLPPVIGQFFIFISENEFKIRKDSGLIMIEAPR